jgi:hypothetical protein
VQGFITGGNNMEKKKATGSFGLPPEMQEEIRKSKAKANGENVEEEAVNEQPKQKKTKKAKKPEYTDSESIPEEVEAKVEADEKTEEDELNLEEIVQKMKDDLEIEFDEDDLYNLWMSVLEKEVAVVKGKVYAKLKTLSGDEDEEVLKAREEAFKTNTLEASIANRTAVKTLHFAVLGLGPKGKVKSLGNTPEERAKSLGKINTIMIERLMTKLRDFSFVCKYVQGEEDELKKS